IDGTVKNCIVMNKGFGNIRETSIEAILKTSDICNFWAITKDDIEICKDCEFRYICKDCRAFVTNPGDIKSQPSKCKYNPYIAKWDYEDGYYSVSKYTNKE
ncbi:MAG: SPASM domain-containing protein, partial [Bacteroidales bacterium]|nr:SPASM domain-containing protein [Bacteroidales bacterium]